MGGDVLLAEPVAQGAGHALGQAPGVDEDQRGPVPFDQRRHAVVEALGRLSGQHRFQRRIRQFDGEIPLAPVSRVDDATIGAAGQEASDFLDGILGGGKSHPIEFLSGQPLQPFQRKRQVRAALAADERVDFIHDHGARGFQHAPSAFAGEEDIGGLRRRDQDVGRAFAHDGPEGGRGVPGADLGADRHPRRAVFEQLGVDAFQRRFQVLVDVVAERLERRDVQHTGFVRQPEHLALPHQIVDGREKRRQGLARAGGRGDQCMLPGLDGLPGQALALGGRGEGFEEPAGNSGMEMG